MLWRMSADLHDQRIGSMAYFRCPQPVTRVSVSNVFGHPKPAAQTALTAPTPRAVHPMGETAKLRTAVSVHCLRLAVFGVKRQIGRGRRGALCERSVAHARQPGCSMPSLELGRRAIGGEHLVLRPDRGVH